MSAFEFFRNKALDAKAYFATIKPDDNQSEYGVTAGGPIQKNRMFFFVTYDGYRDRRQTASVLTSVPTLAQRNGDFSALPVTIYDPRTTRPNPNGTGFVRDPFPNNVIPQDRISSISRYFQSFLPAPTTAGLQSNYLGGSLPIGFNNDNFTGKFDLKLDRATAVLVSLRARETEPVDRVPRRHQSPDGAAAAVHGNAAGRGSALRRPDQTHLRDRVALGESGELRVFAPVGADLQRNDRRAVPDRGGVAGIAGWRSGFGIP